MDGRLTDYIEQTIIPLYHDFDAAHREDHVLKVIRESLRMAAFYDVNTEIVYTIAAFHDTGLCVDRDTHHIISGNNIRNNLFLKSIFTDEQIEIMAQAVEDHRASNSHEPRSIYGKIVAEADRLIDSNDIVRRTVQYGLSHYPNYDKESIWRRSFEHLREKYAEGGYLKLWIPESGNIERLKRLRALINDEPQLRKIFEEIYKEEYK